MMHPSLRLRDVSSSGGARLESIPAVSLVEKLQSAVDRSDPQRSLGARGSLESPVGLMSMFVPVGGNRNACRKATQARGEHGQIGTKLGTLSLRRRASSVVVVSDTMRTRG